MFRAATLSRRGIWAHSAQTWHRSPSAVSASCITTTANSKCLDPGNLDTAKPESLDTTELGSLVFSGKKIQFSPGEENFEVLRTEGHAYFDRTSFIYEASRRKAAVFLRPKQFGKTLTVSTLQYFHGIEYRNKFEKLFRGLAISELVPSLIEPGKYLVMRFNFSGRPGENGSPTEILKEKMALGLIDFILRYTPYLGDSFFPLAFRPTSSYHPMEYLSKNPVLALHLVVLGVSRYLETIREKTEAGEGNKLSDVNGIYLLVDEYSAVANNTMDPDDPTPWGASTASSLQKRFLTTVKECSEITNGIERIFLTGITPLLLTESASSFNISTDLSFNRATATACGLTEPDVLQALRHIYNDEEKVNEHLDRLKYYANGYHFCRQPVQTVYNTQVVIWYLEQLLSGKVPNISDPPHAEVSNDFLLVCASAPAAIEMMEAALQQGGHRRIKYNDIASSFMLADLKAEFTDRSAGASAWHSLIVHMGGLTFDPKEPGTHLKIPNRIAAERFGRAFLTRFGLHAKMSMAVARLSSTGDLKQALRGYLQLIRQYNRFKLSEEYYRDSFYVAILENPALSKVIEYQLTRESGRKGFAGLIIESKNFYNIVEFKNVQIFYLDLESDDLSERAEELSMMSRRQVLDLEFNERGKFQKVKGKGKNSVEEWLAREAEDQLKPYVLSDDTQKKAAGKKFRAYTVAIIGSRQILVREMDLSGHWVGSYHLLRAITDPAGYEPAEVEEQAEIGRGTAKGRATAKKTGAKVKVS